MSILQIREYDHYFSLRFFYADDWEELYIKAGEERVTALLHWSLKNSSTASNLYFPDDFLYNLRTKYYDTWVRNTILFQELRTIMKKFENTDIKMVVFIIVNPWGLLLNPMYRFQ